MRGDGDIGDMGGERAERELEVGGMTEREDMSDVLALMGSDGFERAVEVAALEEEDDDVDAGTADVGGEEEEEEVGDEEEAAGVGVVLESALAAVWEGELSSFVSVFVGVGVASSVASMGVASASDLLSEAGLVSASASAVVVALASSGVILSAGVGEEGSSAAVSGGEDKLETPFAGSSSVICSNLCVTVFISLSIEVRVYKSHRKGVRLHLCFLLAPPSSFSWFCVCKRVALVAVAQRAGRLRVCFNQ